MPKKKTHKSAQKRIVRLTSNRKLVLRKMSVQHRARFKSKRAKQQASKTLLAQKGQVKKIMKLVGR